MRKNRDLENWSLGRQTSLLLLLMIISLGVCGAINLQGFAETAIRCLA